MNALIQQLKDAGEDFEFYPTTDEIIARTARDLKTMREGYRYRRPFDTLLDIGAGSGKVLRALGDAAELSKLYAIEKSTVLCERLPANVFIVGADFREQSLLSKQVDVIFCNPPYSEFVEWAVKIIRESAAPLVYLVVPVRWKESERIADAIKFREAKYKTLGEFSFEDAEDRAARAVVNLIRIELAEEKDDAFDRFFEEQFAGLKAKFDALQGKKAPDEEPAENPKFRALVPGGNYPERLVALYNEEMEHIRHNYDLVSDLDADLLREFDVTPKRVLECLKARLAGLRNVYWKELFDHMKQVTDRLTSKKRRNMLDTLNANAHVDFTLGNIHAVVLWVLKNANHSLDSQLVETFEKMVEKANVRNYKSNLRPFVHDRWRYEQDKPTHIALEYRIVLEHVGGICRGYSFERGLDESAADFLGDLLTVARNLGFACDTNDGRLWRNTRSSWTSGALNVFACTIAGEHEPLFEVRAYLNRNVHMRLNQKFALALNVEYGRLKGWLKSGAEAAEELKDRNAPKYFGKSLQIGQSSLVMLGYGTRAAAVPADQPELPLEAIA